MTRTGHRLLGASCALAVAAAAGLPPTSSASVVVVAALVAPWPDVDQRKWWRDFFTGYRPFQHRRLTHWWGLPAVAAIGLPFLPPALAWLLGSALIGWTSHLLGDWVFGKRGPRSTGWRGAGIPLAPWWGYHGLGLTCGGTIERWVAWPLLGALVVAQSALMIGAV